MKGHLTGRHDLGPPAIEDASSLKGLLIACCIAAFLWTVIALLIIKLA